MPNNNQLKKKIALCPTKIKIFYPDLNVTQVVSSNPTSIITSISFQSSIQPVANLLKSVGAETMLVNSLTFIMVNKEQDAFLHSILQRAINCDLAFD